MSRHHRKNLYRGAKSPLVDGEQRVRTERHGKPQTMRKWSREEVAVAAGTPDAKHRIVEDPETKELVVQHYVLVDTSAQVPMTEARKVRVAKIPTANYGKKNAVENMAPRGKKVAKS